MLRNRFTTSRCSSRWYIVICSIHLVGGKGSTEGDCRADADNTSYETKENKSFIISSGGSWWYILFLLLFMKSSWQNARHRRLSDCEWNEITLPHMRKHLARFIRRWTAERLEIIVRHLGTLSCTPNCARQRRGCRRRWWQSFSTIIIIYNDRSSHQIPAQHVR